MKVYCHTNLDVFNEKWPTELPALPAIGHRIQSQTKHGVFQLELEVVGITWEKHSEWIPRIVLHIPGDKEYSSGSITAFYKWYAPLVGKTVGAFI